MIEGAVLVREALAAGLALEAIYAGPGAPDDLLSAGVPVVHLAPGVIEKVASTVTPQPVAAVAPAVDRPLAALAGATFLVVAAGIADPGNLGTILRAAEAAGADGVVLTPGTVDLHNPKVVRASAGALFHVPVAVDVALADLHQLGVDVVATSSHEGRSYHERDWTTPVAVVVGNEAHGLSADELAQCDDIVTIPRVGRAESLNVAMAAAVLCFEVARHRR